MIEKKLYEVTHEVDLGVNQFGESIVLEVGERVFVYFHHSFQYPQIKGYDIVLEDIEDCLKEVK